MSFRLEVFILSLGLKLHSFDACQLFTCSSLKWRSFGVDLAKKKKKKCISMILMCHLTTKINCGGWIANGTKLQGVKSSFWNFGVWNPVNPKLQECNLQFTPTPLFGYALQSVWLIYVCIDLHLSPPQRLHCLSLAKFDDFVIVNFKFKQGYI